MERFCQALDSVCAGSSFCSNNFKIELFDQYDHQYVCGKTALDLHHEERRPAEVAGGLVQLGNLNCSIKTHFSFHFSSFFGLSFPLSHFYSYYLAGFDCLLRH